MVYGSAFSDEFRDAAGFGWDVAAPGFDLKTLMQKKVRALAAAANIRSSNGCAKAGFS